MWLISALSFCDSVTLVGHTTRRTRSVTHTQSRTDTPHGLLLSVMDDHGVQTRFDTFNHCVPPRKHCIIRSFK